MEGVKAASRFVNNLLNVNICSMEKTKIEVNVLEFMIKNAENFIF